MGRIGQCHIWPLRKTLQSLLHDVDCKPREAKKEREPIARQPSVTTASVYPPPLPCETIFSPTGIKVTIMMCFMQTCIFVFVILFLF